MKKRLFILVASLVLGACQGSATVRDITGVDRFTQLQGASVVLHQNLGVAAGKARIYLQGGEVSGGFDSYKPHCAFEINSVRHEGVQINADTFVISRVQGSIQQVVVAEPVRLAAMHLMGGLNGGGSASFYQGYHFWLTSANQPEVRRMSCFGVYAQPYELYPPTIQEIGRALGSLAEIRQ